MHPFNLQLPINKKKYTWQSNCPIPLNQLVEVKLSYWSFDNKVRQGILIINKNLAAEVVPIFKAFQHKFPIERMQLIEDFKSDDQAPMAANNTSAFNCRPITGQPGFFSQHSYGRAIDINPLLNPYVKQELVLPAAGKAHVTRSPAVPGKISKDSFIYAEFTQQGWDWGGDWLDVQDFKHFEKRENGEKRNPYGYR